MEDVTLVGIDLGKHTFHLHGQDKKGKGLFRKKLNRKQTIEFFATFHACTVVMRPAPAHITWLASWRRLDIKLSLSRRSSSGPS